MLIRGHSCLTLLYLDVDMRLSMCLQLQMVTGRDVDNIVDTEVYVRKSMIILTVDVCILKLYTVYALNP
jgi:hypothetical protein